MTQNSASLEAARRHVANLAHAIKTPLASLAVQLDCEDASPESRALVTQVSERIAHHLRRARSAAIGLGGRARCDIADSAADLTQTMRRLFAGRNVKIDNRIAASAVASVDPEDLSEMLGNVLENACRFARSLVNLEMHLDGRVAHIVVSDDGPGIPPDKIPIALRAGERLEETSGGYGFGLVIAKELAELYGGSLTLSPSDDLGGLRVTIVVPRKVAQDAPG
jgi:signal transduction histidine kinase